MKMSMKLVATTLAGLAFSSLAFGQAVNEVGALTATGPILATDCTVLQSDSQVSLSNNTQLAFKCSPVYNQIVLMSCNTAGSRTAATENCKFTVDATGTATYNNQTGTWNDSSCTAETDANGNPIQFDIAGGRYFKMSSAGGGVTTSGGAATDTCDAATLKAVIVQ